MTKMNGFTLIELLVTIAVIAILAMIAAPTMSNTINSYRLNSNARDLVLVVTNARSQAVSFRNNVTVNINSNAADTPGTLNWMAKNGVVYKSTSIKNLVFHPDGRLDSASETTLKLCNSDQTKSRNIVITLYGSVQISEEQVSC